MTVPNPLLHPVTGTDYRQPIYVTRDGRPRYPIGGAAEETPEEKAAREQREADEAAAAAEAKTFTQEELQRIAAKEKRDGKASGQLELAKELGYETVEAMKAAAQKQREAEEAAKSEEQKRLDEIARREKAAEEREAKAAERERVALRKDALRDLGAKGEDLEDALSLLRVADDADEETVAEAAEALKERRPELFKDEPADPPEKKKPAAKLPSGRPGERKKPEPAEVGAAGLDRARRKGWVE